jgi:osmotically-inducible protein OsmY
MVDNQQIKKDIVDKLYWDSRVDASNIRIDINEGEVMLFGIVPHYTAKQAALEDVCATLGVKRIKDQIVVRYSTARIPTDEELCANILNTLSLNASINHRDIKVTVDGGQVALGGAVESYWQKMKAEELIYDIIGVIEVVNKLSVVPSGDFIDNDIAEDIINIFDKSLYVDSQDIGVAVDDGFVSLTGNVPNWRVKNMAVSLARNTPGVRNVIDYLNVV